ncbi:hypothetical protein L3X38_029872 [Prunus dulcis]|uniref:Uncharacterized protein n=1 Tax=Prunus dulcis TaxID=3755 RepID=A0AAD4Z2U8_PRUDU|nr:hypothetical protein L3X38_029872 [Prunus dulcis]
MKNGVLIIQTLRNNIMASSLLATTAITLSSVISVFVSTSSSSSSDSTVSQQLVYTIPLSSIKCFCILLCFLVGFLCNVQSTRYFAHASFLATLPTGKDKTDYIEYVSTTVNRGSYFWSLGLRAFYLSIPLFLWIFGAIPVFVCCCIMTNALNTQPPVLHNLFAANPSKRKGEPMMSNQLVIHHILFWILWANSGFEDFLIRRPLLTDYDSVSAANVAR